MRDRHRSMRGALVFELSRHLGCKIGTLAINSLTEGEARKAGHANRCPIRLCRLLDDTRNPGLLIDDKDLLKQDDFLIKLAQSPFDHFLHNALGPAAGPRLIDQHPALSVQRRLRYRENVE